MDGKNNVVKPVEYKLVVSELDLPYDSSTADKLNSAINSLLKEGWFLYGSPSLIQRNDKLYKVCQAMVKF